MDVFSDLQIGVEVFGELECLRTEKLSYGGRGITGASHRKHRIEISSLNRLQ